MIILNTKTNVVNKVAVIYYVLASIGLSVVLGQLVGLTYDYVVTEIKRLHITQEEIELMRQDHERLQKEVYSISRVIAH